MASQTKKEDREEGISKVDIPIVRSATRTAAKRPSRKDFPGQSSPLFRALLAEIVAESVCRKALALEARERPFDFRWADMGKPEEIVDDVFAQFQQRQREFLARAHEIMLGQEELNSVTAGTGSQK